MYQEHRTHEPGEPVTCDGFSKTSVFAEFPRDCVGWRTDGDTGKCSNQLTNACLGILAEGRHRNGDLYVYRPRYSRNHRCPVSCPALELPDSNDPGLHTQRAKPIHGALAPRRRSLFLALSWSPRLLNRIALAAPFGRSQRHRSTARIGYAELHERPDRCGRWRRDRLVDCDRRD